MPPSTKASFIFISATISNKHFTQRVSSISLAGRQAVSGIYFNNEIEIIEVSERQKAKDGGGGFCLHDVKQIHAITIIFSLLLLLMLLCIFVFILCYEET